MSHRRDNIKLGPLSAWRARLVLALFAVFAVVLVVRAFDLQVLDSAHLTKLGQRHSVRSLTVPAVRGAIRDRNGRLLALSAPTESVWAVPSAVLAQPAKLVPLAKTLHMSTHDLQQRLASHEKRKFLYLRRQLSPAHAKQVMAVNAPGIFLQREYRRYYPAGAAAAKVVGLANIDGKGQLGVELALNHYLQGKPGKRRVVEDRLGRVAEDLAGFKPAQPGKDVTLTLDVRLQSLAYRKIKSAVIANKAKNGMVVILDPSSGQLLAMASYPSFNPNDRSTITPGSMRALAVTNDMEPGSTIKPMLLSHALTTGQFTTNSLIDASGGRLKIGGFVVTDHHDYGIEDFARILKKSSNVGAAHVGLALGAESVWQGYRTFGLGQRSGIDFPGESYGVLKPYYKWGKLETATASYGYGFSVTALQLVRAYGAIADGGLLREIRLIRGAAGYIHQKPKRVISGQVAREIRHMLEGVVTPGGTAPKGALKGYQVAGKTGTSHIASAGGYSNRYHALFVGMVPADHPRLVILVVVNDPTARTYYGGWVSAPVFAQVARKALRILGVPPQHPKVLTASTGQAPGDRS